jgi:hypothetical protein
VISCLWYGDQADTAYPKCGLTKVLNSGLIVSVVQYEKERCSIPRTASALLAATLLWWCHFKSLEICTPRSLSTVVVSKSVR